MDYKDIDLETHKKNKLYYADVLASYSESGYVHNKHECPACGAINWLYQGDLDDVTQPDREGCICYNCKHDFYVIEPDIIPDFFCKEFDEAQGDLEKMIKDEVGFFEEGTEKAPYE